MRVSSTASGSFEVMRPLNSSIPALNPVCSCLQTFKEWRVQLKNSSCPFLLSPFSLGPVSSVRACGCGVSQHCSVKLLCG